MDAHKTLTQKIQFPGNGLIVHAEHVNTGPPLFGLLGEQFENESSFASFRIQTGDFA